MVDGERRGSTWIAAGLSVLLAGAVCAAFAPVFGAEFVRWDDPRTVTENAWVHGLSGANLRWAFTRPYMGHFQPLTWLSYMIEYGCWGLEARWYHVTNVAIHAVNCVLVYALGLRLIVIARRGREGAVAGTAGDHLGAALGAALFGLHPLRVETVAWVTERRDVLSAMFMLLAVLAYLRSVEPGRVAMRSVGWCAASVVLLLASVLCKAWGMSFFVIVLLLDVYPVARIGWGSAGLGAWVSRDGARLIAQKWAFVLIGVATAGAAVWAQRTGEATKSLAEWGVGERAVQGVYGLWFYLKASVWPAGLSPLYELPRGLNAGEWRFLMAYLGLGAVVAVAAWKWKAWPGLGVTLAIYAVLLAPVLGVLQSGDQFVADRYSYLASIGWCVLAGAVVSRVRAARVGEFAGAVGGACALGSVAVLGVLTWAQAGCWHDTLTLWRTAAQRTPTPGVRVSYALELARLGGRAEAEVQLRLALKDREEDGVAWALLADLELDVGHVAGEHGAEGALLKAVRYMKPPVVAMVNLGSLYLTRLNRPGDAIVQFEGAVRAMEAPGLDRPASGGAYLGLGFARLQAGDRAGAVAALRRAAEFADTRLAAEGGLARCDRDRAAAEP